MTTNVWSHYCAQGRRSSLPRVQSSGCRCLSSQDRMLESSSEPGFSQAAPILVLLTMGNVANVLVGLCGTVLIMNHLEGTVASIQWFGVLARTVLGIVAATEFGAVGMGASARSGHNRRLRSMWRVARTRMGLNTHLTLRPDFRLIRSTAG